MDRPTAVDLFAGAGGFSLGLIRAGFDLILANEASVDAEWTYRHNLLSSGAEVELPPGPEDETQGARKRHRAAVRARLLAKRSGLATDFDSHMRGGPIQLAMTDDWLIQWKRRRRTGLDLLVAGPPCQGFSSAGRRDHEDERNGLVKEALRVAEILEPKIVVIENVPGMLHGHGGLIKHVGERLTRMGRHGYVVAVELLHALLLGVPQTRKRLIVVAVRRDFVDSANYPYIRSLVFPVGCSMTRPPFSRQMGLPVPTGDKYTAEEILGDLLENPPIYGYPGSLRTQYAVDAVTGAFRTEMRTSRELYLDGRIAPSPESLTSSCANHEASFHEPSITRRMAVLRTFAASSVEATDHRCSSRWLKQNVLASGPTLNREPRSGHTFRHP